MIFVSLPVNGLFSEFYLDHVKGFLYRIFYNNKPIRLTFILH
jgi:hypothetical protein